MLDRGANINAQNMLGETPLHGSCAEGVLDVSMLLVRRGADTTITNEVGRTPFGMFDWRCPQEKRDLIISAKK